MGLFLIFVGLAIGVSSYDYDSTRLLVLGIVLATLGVLLEIVGMILDHRKEMARPEQSDTKSLA